MSCATDKSAIDGTTERGNAMSLSRESLHCRTPVSVAPVRGIRRVQLPNLVDENGDCHLNRHGVCYRVRKPGGFPAGGTAANKRIDETCSAFRYRQSSSPCRNTAAIAAGPDGVCLRNANPLRFHNCSSGCPAGGLCLLHGEHIDVQRGRLFASACIASTGKVLRRIATFECGTEGRVATDIGSAGADPSQ